MRRGSGFLSSIQPRNCQIARKSSMSLISGVPVSAISSGVGPCAPGCCAESASTCCERCDVLFLMKCASSTTMPLKPRRAEPADVPVEHLVVDDDDVGERVDVVAVTVDDGRAALRGPPLDLARPVDLDDVRARRPAAGRRRRPAAASSACAVLPRPGSSASRKVRWPSRRLDDIAAWWGISSRLAGGVERARPRAGPCTRRRRRPSSNERNSGSMSSQLASRPWVRRRSRPI